MQIQDDQEFIQTKFTKLYEQSIKACKIRVSSLYIFRISIMVIMLILNRDIRNNCTDTHNFIIWTLSCAGQAFIQSLLYLQLLFMLHNQKVLLSLGIEYGQVIEIPQGDQVQDQELDPTLEFDEQERKRLAARLSSQIRLDLVNTNYFAKINNIFSVVSAQVILGWSLYILVNFFSNQTFENECHEWAIFTAWFYCTLLLYQYSPFYSIALSVIIMLPCILIFILMQFCKDRADRQRQLEAIRELEKNIILYHPQTLEGDPECSICLQPYAIEDKVLILTCSKYHHFHVTCIKTWLTIQAFCPLCKQPIVQDLQNMALLED